MWSEEIWCLLSLSFDIRNVSCINENNLNNKHDYCPVNEEREIQRNCLTFSFFDIPVCILIPESGVLKHRMGRQWIKKTFWDTDYKWFWWLWVLDAYTVMWNSTLNSPASQFPDVVSRPHNIYLVELVARVAKRNVCDVMHLTQCPT